MGSEGEKGRAEILEAGEALTLSGKVRVPVAGYSSLTHSLEDRLRERVAEKDERVLEVVGGSGDPQGGEPRAKEMVVEGIEGMLVKDVGGT